MPIPTTPVNTTNFDNSTDTLALARPDVLALAQLVNGWITYMNAATGFAMRDSNNQLIVGTGVTFGINATSGFPRLVLSATVYMEWDTTLNKLNWYVSGVLTGSMPIATPATNNYADLLGKPTLGNVAATNAGTGLSISGGNLNVIAIASVCFSAYTTSGRSANTDIVFDTTDFNVNTWYNTSNGKFTPLAAGKYRVRANIRTTVGAHVDVFAKIFKNGSVYKQEAIWTADGADYTMSVEAIVSMNGSTDFITIQSNQAVNAATSSNRYTAFEANYLGT